MRAYHRLTEGQRNQVYALMKAGLSQRAIADQIGVHKSTICSELRRNKGLHGYRRKQAHHLACSRQPSISRRRISEARWARIGNMLREDWSRSNLVVTCKPTLSQVSAPSGFISISILISVTGHSSQVSISIEN